MRWLYVVELVVLLAAVPGVWWLRRAGDRSWRAHRQRVLLRPVAEAFIRMQLEVVDRFTPALRQVAREVARMGAAVERMRPAFEEVARTVNDELLTTRTGGHREGGST